VKYNRCRDFCQITKIEKGHENMEEQDTSQIILDWTTDFLRMSMHDLNRFVRTHGLSMVQMNVLLHLFYQGPSEVMNFCDLMQVSPAGASQMIERLVQQDLVQRKESSGDRRVRVVDLTEHGKQIVRDSISARQSWVEELVNNFSEEEKALVKQALAMMNQKAGDLFSQFKHGRDC
jgi:DNA-binding MarR family transcriptional regulator